MTAINPPTDNPFCILDRYAPLSSLDEHDYRDDGYHNDHEQQKNEEPHVARLHQLDSVSKRVRAFWRRFPRK